MIIDVDEIMKPVEKYYRNKYKRNTVHAICPYCGRKATGKLNTKKKCNKCKQFFPINDNLGNW